MESTTTEAATPAQTAHAAPTARTIEVQNPATGEVIATRAGDRAGGRGRASSSAPARPSPAGRRSASTAAPRCSAAPRSGSSTTPSGSPARSCRETGKTYEDAQLAEVSYAADAFGFWAKHAAEYLADERVRSSNPFVLGRKLVVRYAPVGVVGVIGPWNYPLTNSFGDCIPALAAGNSVVLKPASLTPLTSLLMPRCSRECGMPEDVFQVAVGARRGRRELIDHVDFVMFTGSTEVGKKVMERAARTLTPVGLELGGKDPMIVLARRRRRARRQRRRLLLDAERRPDLHLGRARLRRGARLRRVRATRRGEDARAAPGAPSDPGTVDVGAVTSPPQVDLIDGHVQDAVSKGARVVTGGKRGEGAGDFYEPTLLVDVDHSMECMTEETFGPTLPVMKVARRRGGGAARERLALRAPGVGLDQGRRQGRAARAPGRGGRVVTSTTRRSTTWRSSCRWAAGRSPASARATARAGSASTRSSRRSWSRGFGAEARHPHAPVQGAHHEAARPAARLVYGRGKRD